MTANDSFDRDLLVYLESEVPIVAPSGLHDGVIDLARRLRQRPGWLVGMRGGAFGTSGPGSDLAFGRAGYVLVVVALLVATLLVAIAAGALRFNPSNPLLGRNGAIVFDLQAPETANNMVNPDGTGLSLTLGNCPTFSPDGSVLAYWTGDSPELMIARSDGSAPRRLFVFGEGAHPEDRFALSPDGTQFAWIKRLRAFERADPGGGSTIVGWNDELWIMPVAGGPGVRILAISGATDESRLLPLWSPDGLRIAYTTYVVGESTSFRSSIDVIDKDGTNRRRLTTRAAGGLGGMSWSPDGRFLAFAGVPDAARLPSPDTREWSPDGFDPALDLFVIGADGEGERNLTNSAVGETAPQWSPDGSHLAYLTSDATVGQRLDTLRMDGPAAIAPPFLGPSVARYFTWSPDGTRLLVHTETPSGLTGRGRSTRSTLKVVDAEFRTVSTTLVAVDYLVLCAPSWQRLDP